MAQPKLVRTGTGKVPRPGRLVGNPDGTISVEGMNQLNSYLQTFSDKFNVDGISLGDDVRNSQAGNLDAQRIEIKFTGPDEEREINHSLRRVPSGYLVVMQNSDGNLLATNLGGWGQDTIYLSTSSDAPAAESLWAILLF